MQIRAISWTLFAFLLSATSAWAECDGGGFYGGRFGGGGVYSGGWRSDGWDSCGDSRGFSDCTADQGYWSSSCGGMTTAAPNSQQPTKPAQPTSGSGTVDDPFLFTPPDQVKIKTPITLGVPADAQVRMWGHPTTLRGTTREFFSRMYPNNPVQSEIVVSVPHPDKKSAALTGKWAVTVYPGKKNVFGFYHDKTLDRLVMYQNQHKRLIAIFQVPENAKIYLNDVALTRTGTTRFIYSSREEGEKYENYPVRVTLTREGKETQWSQLMTFTPGKLHRLDFAFDAREQKLVKLEQKIAPKDHLVSTSKGVER